RGGWMVLPGRLHPPSLQRYRDPGAAGGRRAGFRRQFLEYRPVGAPDAAGRDGEHPRRASPNPPLRLRGLSHLVPIRPGRERPYWRIDPDLLAPELEQLGVVQRSGEHEHPGDRRTGREFLEGENDRCCFVDAWRARWRSWVVR